MPYEQGNRRTVCGSVGADEDFTGGSISLPRSVSPAFTPGTSSLVADTRSERFVGKDDARGWIRTLGRLGIASRGVIYLLLAYLAFDIARHGSAPTQTSSTGALQELEARTGGKLLLVVLAIGLGCYAAWRFFDVVTGANGAMRRVSSLSVGIIYGVLCIRAVELVAGHSASGGRLEQSRALGGEGHGMVRWDRGDRSGRRGPRGSGHGTGGMGPLPPVRQELAWSAYPVLGKRRSGSWVVSETWPEGPSSPYSGCISSRQG